MAFLVYNDQNNKTWNNAQLNLQIIPPFSVLMNAEPASLSADKSMTARADIGQHLIHDIGLVQGLV